MIRKKYDITLLNANVYENTDVVEASSEICDFIIDHFNVTGSAIYLYDRLLDKYEIVNFSGHADFPSIVSSESEFQLFPCLRGNLTCGYLAIDGTVSSPETQDIRAISKLIVLLFNRKFTFDLLSRSSDPVDFLQEEQDFYSHLRDLAKESSNMPAGAFRVTQSSSLKTLFQWNDWSELKFNNSDWDIEDMMDEDVTPCFQRCIQSGKIVTAGKSEIQHPFFGRAMQRGVRSAVFSPVKVGVKTIGVLSFAMPKNYDFSSLEKAGFLSLANSIGVSLTNFSRSADAELDMQDDVRLSQILTAVEIAQAARHSARTDLDTLKTYVLQLGQLFKADQNKRTLQKIDDVLDNCDVSILSCFKSLDDIKSAIRPPAKKLQKVTVSSVFDSAKSQIRGRSVKYNVDIKWMDKDADIECYPDHLKQVFLNLLLNSVDAFSNSRRQSNRNVRVRLHNFQENAANIIVRYEDDAGGIDVSGLRMNAEDHLSSVEDLVFGKDITTKGEGGSGWGLYVSRKIVADHGGHMSLIEYGKRTVFDISLMKVINT